MKSSDSRDVGSGHLPLSQASVLHKLEDVVEETEESINRKNTLDGSGKSPAINTAIVFPTATATNSTTTTSANHTTTVSINSCTATTTPTSVDSNGQSRSDDVEIDTSDGSSVRQRRVNVPPNVENCYDTTNDDVDDEDVPITMF